MVNTLCRSDSTPRFDILPDVRVAAFAAFPFEEGILLPRGEEQVVHKKQLLQVALKAQYLAEEDAVIERNPRLPLIPN